MEDKSSPKKDSEGYEIHSGTLRELVHYFDPSTVPHADKVVEAWLEGGEIGNEFVWTADGVYYLSVGGRQSISLTKNLNIIFENIDKSYEDILQYGHYARPADEVLERLKAHPHVASARLDRLSLKPHENHRGGWYYFDVDTAHPEKLNEDQSIVVSHTYTKGESLQSRLEELHDEGLKTLRVFILGQGYVEYATQNNMAITRPTWVNGVGLRFAASGENRVNERGIRMVGKQRKPPYSIAQQDIRRAFKVIGEDPETTKRHLDGDTKIILRKLIEE
jgi:hypothetical protein